MKKKIFIGLGIIFALLVVLGLILAILISLGGARKRAYTPSVPGGVGLAPFAPDIGLPFGEEKALRETEEAVPETLERLVIKTGTINMVVKDIKGSVENIARYVKEKGGWVVSSTVTEREKIPSGSITIRVPAEIFDEAIVYFRGLAEKVTHESTQGQDITEEYVDLQSRLKNLDATEKQLLKIMERSGTITEVLSVQRELTTVRDQIERTKGRIQYLEQSAKMATITLNLALSEELLPIPPSEKWRPAYVLKLAWRNALGALRGISYLVIWLGVYGIIWVPLVIIVWLGRKFWKKRIVRKV